NEASAKALVEIIDLLNNYPTVRVEIASHTDSRGDEDYNLILSQKRAESVVNFLKSKGISSERLLPRGYGESMPLQDCSRQPDCTVGDCECHRLNRRTEFRIIQ
ncbi:MAG: OmpA family protein, partial [Chitinophagales bacterium]|nr:OmpA family protein [Chitinophagales bacterium]